MSREIQDQSPRESQSEAPPLPENPPPAVAPEPPSGREQVRLDTELPPMADWFRSVEDDAPVRGVLDNYGEHMAFNFTLGFASKLDPELMAEHAQPVPYAELVLPIRQDHQFELVRVEGRLRRLTRMKPTNYLEKADEIENLYEGWVFPGESANPICVVVSELPEGLEPNQTGEVDYYVAAEGYFFKLMQYQSGEQNADGSYVKRRAPLLLGRTLREIPRPPVPPNPWLSGQFGMLMLGTGALVIATAVGVLWWFTRTDKRMRAAVHRKRTEINPFDGGTAPPPADPDPPPYEGPSSGPRSIGPYLN